MEPFGTHLPCTPPQKKIQAWRSQKEGYKKRSRKGKKKKAYPGTSPLPFRPVLFVTSSHHFHKECVRSSGLFFYICSHLHLGGRFCIERSTRPEKTFYRVFDSVPALGRQPGTSWNNGVSNAQSPAHFALCFYLSILSSALCIQPDLAFLFFGCSLVLFCFFIYHESTMSFFHIYLLHISIGKYWLLHWHAIVKQSRYFNIFSQDIGSIAITHIVHDKWTQWYSGILTEKKKKKKKSPSWPKTRHPSMVLRLFAHK